MPSEILINVRPVETRVAFVENGVLLDLKIERKATPTLVGSINRGKVIRVLPGMQAAFVDIGLERAAFLYVGDVRMDLEETSDTLISDHGEDEESHPALSAESATDRNKPKIQELLSEGQTLLVQVAKDPIGTKGARITTHVSLAGRYVVFMPTVQHKGVSRRIEDAKERERLKALVESIQPEGGVIVRTAGDGMTEADLKSDLDYLNRLWVEIQRNYDKKKQPGLVHAELDVELRSVRDVLSEDIERVVVDDEETFKKVQVFVSQFMPKFKNRVHLYHGERPIFDNYEVDLEISRSLERKIWLKSGGYIVIDEAEALTVVDVNTGKFVGKKDFEETILKTNLEAIREIAHQLRIRNSGGIIIIDFIDMERETHREKVLNLLNEELARDRAKTTVVSMSNLGLVEMTRKRMRPSLLKTLCEPCPYCEARGYVKQRSTVAIEILSALERETPRASVSTVIQCHPEVRDWIFEEASEMLEKVERKLSRQVIFNDQAGFHREQYEITTEPV